MADISRIRANYIASETDEHASNGRGVAVMREDRSSWSTVHLEQNQIWEAVTRGDKALKAPQDRPANSEGDGLKSAKVEGLKGSNGREMAEMREERSPRPELLPEQHQIRGAATRGDKELKAVKDRSANSEGGTDFVDTPPEDSYTYDEEAARLPQPQSSRPLIVVSRALVKAKTGKDWEMLGSNMCFICMSKGAVFVMDTCGHYGLCNACRRLLVHKRLVSRSVVADTKKGRQQLNNKELQRTKVSCPLCRTEGRVIAIDRHNGTFYKGNDFAN